LYFRDKAEKLAAVHHHLENLPEKDSSNGSGNPSRTLESYTPTPEDFLTPRSTAQEIKRPQNLGLPEEVAYDNVSKWVTTSRGHRSTSTQQQSTPKISTTKSICMQEAQMDWGHDEAATPTPDTPGYGGREVTNRCYLVTSPAPSDTVSRGTLGYADSTSTPALNVLPGGDSLTVGRADWMGSTESLSAIDFGSKEIRLKPNSGKGPSNTYKYTPLRQRLSGGTTSGTVPKSSPFPQFNPSSDLNKPFQPVRPQRTEETNLHRPTPLMTRETQAPSPHHFRSQFH
jgi:hypothetical protein